MESTALVSSALVSYSTSTPNMSGNAHLTAVGGQSICTALIARTLAKAGVVSRRIAAMRTPEVRVLQLCLSVPVQQQAHARSGLKVNHQCKVLSPQL